jgi:hypothetical protein
MVGEPAGAMGTEDVGTKSGELGSLGLLRPVGLSSQKKGMSATAMAARPSSMPTTLIAIRLRIVAS